jgi:uncharacterized repeat protein (TIGR01451 family)
MKASRTILIGGAALVLAAGSTAAGSGAAGSAALAATAAAAQVAGSVSCTAGGNSQCTVTFAETGAAVNWVPPPGVTSVNATLDGAQGGDAPQDDPGRSLQAGGLGATVTATIPVTAGDTYQVAVGGAAPGDGNEAGGFNGGGCGGEGCDVQAGLPFASGGGGGASDIALAGSALVVAGGGGGAGGDGIGNGPDGANGAAGGTGGTSGGPGTSGTDDTLDPPGSQGTGGGEGGPGTANAGGAGGTAGNGPGGSGSPGSTGGASAGGAGGNGYGAGGDGGGGGGGYYGGGGGGGGGAGFDPDTGNPGFGAGGAGAGGGSDYVTTQAAASSIADGAWSGNGQITISYPNQVTTGSPVPIFLGKAGQTLTVATSTGLLTPYAGTTQESGMTASGPASGTSVRGGTVSVNSDGSFSYTPPAGFTGNDDFSYTVTDSFGDYATGVAAILVQPTSLQADLAAALACPAGLKAGATGRCHLTVTNNGPDTAKKVTATITLPSGLSGVSCNRNCTQDGATYTWTMFSLNDSASSAFTLTLTAVAAGPAGVTGQVSATTHDPNPGNNHASATVTVRKGVRA